MTASTYSLLDRKREGGRWSTEEIRSFIEDFMSGKVADYQMSAFLMAVGIRGLSDEEAQALTAAMLESGEQWALRDEVPFLADKHSTGGVGDKISLILSPWLASCGVPIAMLSGRGLGHTGGTLDKLEAIPGFDASLSRKQLLETVERVGCAIATSTPEIAPADRRMYALRDVTGTVRSIPLITASIMSKKLAMGASALVLDVKVGRGAFMKELDEARNLARSLVSAASGSGTRVRALLTDMNQPLGRTIGNANEVRESLAVLRGEGPEDVTSLSRELAAHLMEMNGEPRADAIAALDSALASGKALETAAAWIEAQGGDASVVEGKALPEPSSSIEIIADRSGFIQSVDPLALAEIAVDLGAGRRVQDDDVDHAAGVHIHTRRGDSISAGDRLATLEIGSVSPSARMKERALDAFIIDDEMPPEGPLVLDRIEG